MFYEDGRKIDLGFQVGMSLEGMSIAQLEDYIYRLKLEIDRVHFEMEKLKAHKQAAESLFK
jgi:uncharacterized small protein (DUF1192 family)